MFVEIYVNVVFVMSCLYSAVCLILVREQRFIRIIIIYYYYYKHTQLLRNTRCLTLFLCLFKSNQKLYFLNINWTAIE